jgi:hypothetical protein
MLLSDWVRPTYQGVDSIMASGATPLSTMNSLLATSDGTAPLLVLDRFIAGPREFPWATVRQLGHGFVALLAASVAHDAVVSECPDNPRWLSNVMRHLVDEAARERSLYAPDEPGPANLIGVDVNALIESGEGQFVEFKECAIRELVMRDEAAFTVAAFANAKGGTLLVGVADDGRIIGVDDEIATRRSNDEYLRRVLDVLCERLDPKPIGGSLLLELRAIQGHQVLVATVARVTWACLGKAEGQE